MADWQERGAEEEWDTKPPSRGGKTERRREQRKKKKKMWEHKESLEHLDLQCEMLEKYRPVCVLIYYEYDKYKNVPTYTA